MITEIISCLRGPRLYRIYPKDEGGYSKMYRYNLVENGAQTIISFFDIARGILKFTCPFVLGYCNKKDMFNREGLLISVNFLSVVMVIYFASWVVRGIGRYFNPVYRGFIAELRVAVKDFSLDNKRRISNYDFDLSAWPVEYKASSVSKYVGAAPQSQGVMKTLVRLPVRAISWCMVQTFGLSFVYPGSSKLVRMSLEYIVQKGREDLILKHGGVRYKLKASDGNAIDTMYIERKDPEKKNTLIITCEGNGGYYEIGLMSSAMGTGHSVLGWNHPGFGFSTGRPFPSQECNAASAAIEFAINKLGYEPSDIILYGWSIGGFSASWLAMNYPDVKAVILDATFDNLLPLAVSRMPSMISPFVEEAITRYINLNVSDTLVRYQGLIKLIRRSKDEMITTVPNDLATNRGNDLLLQLLNYRYPHIINSELLAKYLGLSAVEKGKYVNALNIDETRIKELLKGHSDSRYPSSLGSDEDSLRLDSKLKDQLTIYLADLYMVDFNSSHCTPLPVSYLDVPTPLAIS